jgi:Zn-dependent M28 family amino/carboxypeptidase
MKKRPFLAATGLFILAITSVVYLFPAAQQPTLAPAAAQPVQAPVAGQLVQPARQRITEPSSERYLRDVTFLARDEMKGRGAGTPELEMAADYIAEQFRLAGLTPKGENGTYFQPFEVTTGAQLGTKNELAIAGAALKISDDFVPIMISNTAEFDGPLVFAGYGITAPDLNYDDYAGIDVTDKIVVVLRHEPQESNAQSKFDGTNFTRHAPFVNKAINARLHGAKGIVFLSDPLHRDEEVGPATRRIEYTDMGIPSIHAKRAAFARVFSAAGKDLAAIQSEIDKDLQPRSFELAGTRAHIATEVNRIRKTVRNVIGALEGSDPVLKNEWIVVGGHYDHLGLGERDSLTPSQAGQVHHGADDNASGTSGVMELARLAANDDRQWKRSALFMAFAAEEIGLLGSAHFVNSPTVPISSITAMINLDMIGRITNNRVFVGGVGTSPNYRTMLEALNKDTGLTVAQATRAVGLTLDFSESGYGSSDHTSFNSKKIPVLFFFSGLHTDYHKPSDTYDKINAEGAVKVASLVYGLMDRVANDNERPAYVEVQRPEQPGRGGGGGYGAYFGSVPDFREDIQGVMFADVVNNSPAQKAGLKAGDIMVEFDGKPILRLNDYAFLLRSKQPGDVVPVVVKRNGETIRVDVTLETRR